MNRKESFTCFVALFSFALCLAFAVYTDWCHFTVDSHIHASNIQNWKYNGMSDLIIAEGACLYRIILALGIHVRPTFILKIWLILSSVLITACVGIWLRKMMKQSIQYAWWILFMDAGVITLLHFNYFTIHYRLDYNFLAAVMVALTSLQYLNSKVRKVKVAAWIILVISLIHIAYLRTNGLSTIPVISFVAIIYGTRIRSLWKRAIAAACITIGMVSAIKVAMPISLAAHACMRITDIKIASILTNDFEKDREKVHETGFLITSFQEPTSEDTEQRIQPEPFVTGFHAARARSLSELYSEEWKEKPGAMLTARGIVAVQFICAGYTPHFIRSLVATRYPHVKEDSPAWELNQDCHAWDIQRDSYGNNMADYLLRPISFLLGLVCLAMYAMRWRKLDCFQRFFMVVALVAYTYLLSFFVAVPTADNRYLMPVLFLLYCFLSFVAASAVVKTGKKDDAAGEQ